jgi:hypothetical protein
MADPRGEFEEFELNGAAWTGEDGVLVFIPTLSGEVFWVESPGQPDLVEISTCPPFIEDELRPVFGLEIDLTPPQAYKLAQLLAEDAVGAVKVFDFRYFPTDGEVFAAGGGEGQLVISEDLADLEIASLRGRNHARLTTTAAGRAALAELLSQTVEDLNVGDFGAQK